MNTHLPWLEISDPFPDPVLAWDSDSPAPGLLAAGADLSVVRLVNAYQRGIFPWFSHGQPILWWSPDPRMVLDVSHFLLHQSLRKTLQRFRASATCEIRVDHGFHDVMSACAQKPRREQSGTWIGPEMVAAYDALHAAGFAHSVETWVDGRLTGGLYCVGIGRAVFGESMFAHAPDASKIALAALVCLCKRQGAKKIDCQQNTRHLASLGAGEIGRSAFLDHLESAYRMAPMDWKFEPVYWTELLPPLAISA